MGRFLAYSLILLLLGPQQETKAETPSPVAVKIGGVSLSIPSEYLLPDLPSTMVPKVKLDHTDGISLKIPFSHLGLASASSKSLQGNLLVSLSSLGPYMRDHGVNMDAYRAWTGAGLYSKRVIEPDKNTQLYRVGSAAAYPLFWHFFSKRPDGKEPARNAWIASCYESVVGQPSCQTDMAVDKIQSELTFTGDHVAMLPDLKGAYRTLLLSWMEAGDR